MAIRAPRLPPNRDACADWNTDADWLQAATTLWQGDYYTIHIPELGLGDLIRRQPSTAPNKLEWRLELDRMIWGMNIHEKVLHANDLISLLCEVNLAREELHEAQRLKKEQQASKSIKPR